MQRATARDEEALALVPSWEGSYQPAKPGTVPWGCSWIYLPVGFNFWCSPAAA